MNDTVNIYSVSEVLCPKGLLVWIEGHRALFLFVLQIISSFHYLYLYLKDFNYEDMDKMDMGKLVIKDPEDGEVDDDSVTDEVSV